jgi:tetratricopeptide (TPR) repeat protein
LTARESGEWLLSERDLVRLLGLTPRRQAQLRRLGLLKDPTEGYAFREVVALRVARQLLERGATVRHVRRALEALRRIAPEAEAPLAELRVRLEGQRILVESEGIAFDPETRQALLTLDVGDLEREARASLARGMVRPLARPARRAEDWFARAAELDQDPTQWEAAVTAYGQVVALDPGFAPGWNNLGLLHHRMGSYDLAGEEYRRALAADPTCYQAAYNLGSLAEDLGDLPVAVGWYRRALELAPDYADAHFNLAGALAKSGKSGEAAVHWRRYLELDQGSPWAQLARVALGEPDDLPTDLTDDD